MEKGILHTFFVMGLLFSGLAIVVNLIAQKLGFFRFKDLDRPPLRLRYALVGVIGYLIIYFLAAPLGILLIGGTLKEMMDHSFALLMTILQIFVSATVIIYLILFSFVQEKDVLKRIWVHPDRCRFSCLLEDFGLGVVTWLIAFPAVVFVSQFVEFITYFLTGVTGINQVAIRYLKAASESPYLLAIALFTITIAAPIIEEFVFRGLLFSHLKKKLGFKWGLVLSAFLFAMFHFAPSQGVSNFPLISSLFVLSLYLGFLYERQGSLAAPIALHMTFNSISVLRILIFSS